jgi:hypothetical protein
MEPHGLSGRVRRLVNVAERMQGHVSRIALRPSHTDTMAGDKDFAHDFSHGTNLLRKSVLSRRDTISRITRADVDSFRVATTEE